MADQILVKLSYSKHFDLGGSGSLDQEFKTSGHQFIFISEHIYNKLIRRQRPEGAKLDQLRNKNFFNRIFVGYDYENKLYAHVYIERIDDPNIIQKISGIEHLVSTENIYKQICDQLIEYERDLSEDFKQLMEKDDDGLKDKINDLILNHGLELTDEIADFILTIYRKKYIHEPYIERIIIDKYPEKISLKQITEYHWIELIETWLDNGHNINEHEEVTNNTLLWYFCSNSPLSPIEKYDWIDLCLQEGANPNFENGECIYTIISPKNMNRTIMELLFSYGLDPCLRCTYSQELINGETTTSGYLYASLLGKDNENINLEALSSDEMKNWILSKFD